MIEVVQKMTNYQEARVKLTNIQLNKLKSAAKHMTRTTLRITFKIKNCLMNYFEQQDKKPKQEKPLLTICQQI